MFQPFYIQAATKQMERLIGAGEVLVINVTHTGHESIFLCVANATEFSDGGSFVEVKTGDVRYVRPRGDTVQATDNVSGDLPEVQEALESLKKEIHGIKTSLGKLKKP